MCLHAVLQCLTGARHLGCTSTYMQFVTGAMIKTALYMHLCVRIPTCMCVYISVHTYMFMVYACLRVCMYV